MRNFHITKVINILMQLLQEINPTRQIHDN